MSPREKNAAITAQVVELIGDPTIKVKTINYRYAGGWKIIRLSKRPPPSVKLEDIEQILIAKGLVGSYWPDSGPGAYNADGAPRREANLNWEIQG